MVKKEQRERFNLYIKAHAKFGRTKQVLVAIEELAELQKELLKNINREKCNRDMVAEEIADVQIMLEQLSLMYGIEEVEMAGRIEKKMERLRLIVECEHETYS